MSRRHACLPLLAALASLGAAGLPAAASREQPGGAAAPAPLSIESISVTPADPAADTLCELRVKLKNSGAEAASRFAFDVHVGEGAIGVYRHLLYFQAVPAHATVELRLYNFWASETSRPVPPDGKLSVVVTLTAAQWVAVVKDEKGTERTRPLGPVAGLPVTGSLVVPLKARVR